MKKCAVLAVFLAAAACSSSSSSPAGSTDGGGADSGDASVGGAQACTDLATAYCTKVQGCAPIFVEVSFGDVAGCIARASQSCVTALVGNGTSASPATHEACAAGFASASCDDLLNGKPPSACVIAPGKLADAAACGEDAQCQSAFCGKPAGAYCGTCARPPAAGDACIGGRCGLSLACGANAKCVTPGALDATCDANTPCLTTLSCGNGKCAAALAPGATCDPQQKTTPGCQTTAGYYCNTVTTKCTQVTVGTTNQQCGVARNGVTLCSAAGFCRGATATTPGVCIGAAADGAACDDTKGPACMAGSHCVSAVCKKDDPGACN